MKNKLLYLLAIAAIALGQAVYASGQMNGGPFLVKKSVVSNSGGRMSGGAFSMDAAAGQAVAGTQSLSQTAKSSFNFNRSSWIVGMATSIWPSR